jgi:hypothetical protein
MTHRAAREPKQIRILPGAGHVLDEAADEVYAVVHEWLQEHLGKSEDKLRAG